MIPTVKLGRMKKNMSLKIVLLVALEAQISRMMIPEVFKIAARDFLKQQKIMR